MIWNQLEVCSEKVALCILKAWALSGAGAARPLHVKASEQSRKQPGLLPLESPAPPRRDTDFLSSGSAVLTDGFCIPEEMWPPTT